MVISHRRLRRIHSSHLEVHHLRRFDAKLLLLLHHHRVVKELPEEGASGIDEYASLLVDSEVLVFTHLLFYWIACARFLLERYIARLCLFTAIQRPFNPR